MPTPAPPTFTDDLHAVAAGPLVHQLAGDLRHLLARRHRHPLQLHLAYLALQRAAGSANKLDAILADRAMWHRLVATNNHVAEWYGTATLGPHLPPLSATSHRAARARLSDGLQVVTDALTHRSVLVADQVGLLPRHGGSLTNPSPLRTVYGDGTIVRPLYRPGNPTRCDPSIARHVRHDGTHWGNNIVTAYVRGPGRHRRIVLGVDRVERPGAEAATAVQLFGDIHHQAGNRIQAIAYDGALRGTHHNELMRTLGVQVINRVHGAARPRSSEAPRVAPLVNRSHDIDGRTCTHTLVTVDGTVCEATIDATGQQHLSDPLRRVQVRRTRSKTAGYRFTLGIEVPCPAGEFTCWIGVHPHADHMRLLAPTDEHFDRLYGLRNDSESNNQAYKRTLPHRRAAGLGWRRQLLDAVGWAILVNSRALALHGPDDAIFTEEIPAADASLLDGLLARPTTQHEDDEAGPSPRFAQRLRASAAAYVHRVADTLDSHRPSG